MYSIYVEKSKIDLNIADFVSAQADETTDITYKSHFVILFSFIKA